MQLTAKYLASKGKKRKYMQKFTCMDRPNKEVFFFWKRKITSSIQFGPNVYLLSA